MLINSLRQFSKDYVTIERLAIGGEDEDWPVEGSRNRSSFLDREEN